MDNETVIRFIEAYKGKEILWNPRHYNYYNRALKKDAWDELSLQLNRPADELKKKMDYLLSALRREKQKMVKSKTTGQGADAVYKSSWFAYTHMIFLLDKNKLRERLSTEDSTMEENEDTESESESLHSLAAVSNETSGSQEPNNVLTGSRTETQPFTAPLIPTKKPKKRTTHNDPIVMEALQLMRSSAQAASAVTSTAPDSFQMYANYLASKFRTYSRNTFITVEHEINNILYSADSGRYEWGKDHRTSTPESILPTQNIECHEACSRTQTPDPAPNQYVSYSENSLSAENYDTNSVDDTHDFSELIKFNAK